MSKFKATSLLPKETVSSVKGAGNIGKYTRYTEG